MSFLIRIIQQGVYALSFALEPPFVDVRPRTVFAALFIDETKLIVARPGPGHPPLAINSDHRHQAGKDNPVANPALRGTQDSVGAFGQHVDPLPAERIKSDLPRLPTIASDETDPAAFFAKGKSGTSDVGARLTRVAGTWFS